MRRSTTPKRRLATTAATAALALVVAGVYGERLQKELNDGRYEGRDATVDWVIRHAPSARRVGLAGDYREAPGGLASPVLPMFGPRYGNRVTYIGRDLGGMFARSGSRAGFLRALHASHADLLELGLAPAPAVVRLPGPAVPELRWALSAGYRPVARSRTFVLFAAPGFRG